MTDTAVILGCVLGGLAVLWGVVVAFLDQPPAPDHKQTGGEPVLPWRT